jgi:ribosomal protein S3AE
MEPVRRVKVRQQAEKVALVAPVKAVDKDKVRVRNKVLGPADVRSPERLLPGRRWTNPVMLRQSTNKFDINSEMSDIIEKKAMASGVISLIF